MKRMKHRILVAVMILGIMVSLVSCIGNGNDAESESNSVQSQSEKVESENLSDTTEQNTEEENAGKESQQTEDVGAEDTDSSSDASSSDEEFTPMEVEENTQVELGEDETYAIH